MKAITDLAGLKESRVTVLNKQLFGCTPMDDLLAVRLELAKYYLSNGGVEHHRCCTVSDLCDVFYVSRCFRCCVGCPPSRFQQR